MKCPAPSPELAATVQPALFSVFPGRGCRAAEKAAPLSAMVRRLSPLLAAVALVLLPAPAPAQASCDRGCLRRLGETYLAALAAKDVTRLPLTPGVRFTENGSELALGDGLWGTVEGLLDYRF